MTCVPVPAFESWALAAGVLLGLFLAIVAVRAWNDRWRAGGD